MTSSFSSTYLQQSIYIPKLGTYQMIAYPLSCCREERTNHHCCLNICFRIFCDAGFFNGGLKENYRFFFLCIRIFNIYWSLVGVHFSQNTRNEIVNNTKVRITHQTGENYCQCVQTWV